MRNDLMQLVDLPRVTAMRVAIVGAAVGLILSIVGLLLQQFLTPAVCGVDASTCVRAGDISFIASAVIASIGGVFALVRISAYRPLLVAVSSFVTLWGAHGWLAGVAWFELIIWLILLYALAYTLFNWVLRIHNFAVAVAITAVLILIARIVISV